MAGEQRPSSATFHSLKKTNEDTKNTTGRPLQQPARPQPQPQPQPQQQQQSMTNSNHTTYNTLHIAGSVIDDRRPTAGNRPPTTNIDGRTTNIDGRTTNNERRTTNDDVIDFRCQQRTNDCAATLNQGDKTKAKSRRRNIAARSEPSKTMNSCVLVQFTNTLLHYRPVLM